MSENCTKVVWGIALAMLSSQKLLLGVIFNQKKRAVHKMSARNSGAGNGYADFMGAWHFWVLSAGKPPCLQNSSFWGAGVLGFFLKGGVWKC